jgi:hypothetical protein
MWPYWVLFFVFAFHAITKLRPAKLPLKSNRIPDKWRIVLVVLVLMIGLRHEVGGDWAQYLSHVEAAGEEGIKESLTRGDPAFSLLNWLGAHSGMGSYFINTAFAVLFSWGLVSFCRNQPRPWLALVVAVPYLVTVVAMGYSRQGAAIGLVMFGLVALTNGNVLKFMFWVALAATFHKSAVILVPLALLTGTRRWFLTLVWVGLIFALLFMLFLQEAVEGLVTVYIGAEYDSSGAAIRVAMNAIPALIFLLRRKRFMLPHTQLVLWTWMAWGALAFVVLLYLSPSSTAVDRVALYWIPLQLFVWSRVPDAMGKSGGANAAWVFVVVGYSAVIYFVWLFFATHAVYWLP